MFHSIKLLSVHHEHTFKMTKKFNNDKICVIHPFPRIFNDLEKFVTSLVNTDLEMSPKLQKGALTAKEATKLF